MKTNTAVTRSNDTEYGSVANGVQVGSGFDCDIKRESAGVAIINLTTPNGDTDRLAVVDVEPDEDLQVMARDIANCPGSLTDFVSPDDSGWDDLATRWDAIEVV